MVGVYGIGKSSPHNLIARNQKKTKERRKKKKEDGLVFQYPLQGFAPNGLTSFY
jgi:hypothetical protein